MEVKLERVRFRWFEHVLRRDSEYIGQRMFEMKIPEKRRRGRPQII